MHLPNPKSKANRHKPAAQKLCGGFLTGLIAATLLVTARGVAPAAGFGLPVALATNNLGGYKVSSALDTNADGIALWSGQSTHRPGATGEWSAAQSSAEPAVTDPDRANDGHRRRDRRLGG